MKPKILYILHFPPPVHGAAMVGQYIRESKTINDAFAGLYINLGTSNSIDEIGKGGVIKLWKYFVLLLKTIFTVLRFRPNLVYVTLTSKGNGLFSGFYKDALLVIIVKILGAKMVYHLHNKGVSTRQNRWFDNIIYRIVFKNSDIILLSEHLYPDIQKYVPRKQVHICPNGIPDTVPRLKVRKVESKPVEILFISNLIESKGVMVLLNACKILSEKGLNFHCTYVGGEGNISTVELQKNIYDRQLENVVHYAGKKYDIEKQNVFSEADVFVLPTFNDCFPLVLLEAMQFSLPIISTYEGGIPEIIECEKTGFLVPQNNIQSLANKLEILIKNPDLRKEFGKGGREKYEAEFTLAAFELQFASILKKLVR